MNSRQFVLARHQLALRAAALIAPEIVEAALQRLVLKRKILQRSGSLLLISSRLEPDVGRGLFDFGLCDWNFSLEEMRRQLMEFRDSLFSEPCKIRLPRGSVLVLNRCWLLSARRTRFPGTGSMHFVRVEADLNESAFCAADVSGTPTGICDFLAAEKRLSALSPARLIRITRELGQEPELEFFLTVREGVPRVLPAPLEFLTASGHRLSAVLHNPDASSDCRDEKIPVL